MVKGDIGENLIGKYTANGLLYYDDVLTVIFYVLRKECSKIYDKKLNSILSSSEKWLRNLYMLTEIFEDKINIDEKNNYKLSINFDFPGWLTKNHLPFDQFNKHTTYELNYDFNRLNYVRNEINSISDKHKGIENKDLNKFVEFSIGKGADYLEKRFRKIS